ncbi:MAG TPA: MXAN_5808 family serine peptidase, partial [Kofleriaceae bacterium]|nr:MXAN_5808 family serine peptidase [Kofleriaceae bacterium]
DSPWRLASSLKRIFRFIESNMNPGADLAQVEYAAVNGMLSTLDPHSVLLDPEMAREMEVNTGGHFGGLGIVIGMRQRKLTVIRPMRGTPAWEAGIKANDTIVRINDEVTENLTLNEAVDRMRGRKGTRVTLWIERKGAAAATRFDLVRDEIRVPSVQSKLLTRKVGYIRLQQFAGRSTDEVREAIASLRKQGAKSWVLDLRWNPGGLLEQAIQVTDLFVDQGTIVTTVGGNEREPRRAERSPGDVVNQPLVVLVNGGSASASEIVAGALKNLDRALVIGTTTFGKGSVQILYDNDDGSKLKLTIAQYLTPGDLSIQSLGIVPDIELSRMWVPPRNQGPDNFVRLLPPVRSYREKDLKAHLDSTYAKEGPRPEHTLSFLYEPPARPDSAADEQDPGDAAPPGQAGPAGAEDEEPAGPDEEPPAEDEFVMDFEIGLARDVLAEAGAPTRKGMVKRAGKLLAVRRAQETKKLVDKLAALGVDWNAPPAGDANAARPTLSGSFHIEGNNRNIKAGQLVKLVGTVQNAGSVPAYRVHARVKSDDELFDESELVFGKIDPGKSKSWTAQIKVPDEAIDRVDHLDFDVREARGATVKAAPLALRVVAADRPIFAYSHQLLDDGNGDGVVQEGEKHRLRVAVKNIGKGEARDTTAVLRNASGTDLLLKKTRFELGSLKPGEVRSVEFSFTAAPSISAKEVVVELTVYDSVLREAVAEKLHYPLHKSAPAVSQAGGAVQVSDRTARVYEGASADSVVIASAPRNAVFRVTGKVSDWLRVELEGGRAGFVQASEVSRSERQPRTAGLVPRWQVTPPALAIEVPSYEVSGSTFKLKGRATDDTHVEDVYVFVSNRDAKVDNRKVFYRSNRGAARQAEMSFAPEIPLWPGSNLVTVVVRENDDVKSAYNMFLYRPAAGQPTASAR